MRGSTLYLSWTSIGAQETYNLFSACQTTPNGAVCTACVFTAYLSAFWRRQSQLPWVCLYQCPEPLPLQLDRSSLHPGACPGSVCRHQTEREKWRKPPLRNKISHFHLTLDSLLLRVQECRTRGGIRPSAKPVFKAPPWFFLKSKKQNTMIISLLFKPNCVCESILLAKGVKVVPGQQIGAQAQ